MSTTTGRTGAEGGAVGAPLSRVEGPEKVTGAARYAYEYQVEGAVYVHPVLSTIAKGRVAEVDTAAAEALPGVLAVLTHENAPKLDPPRPDLAVLQSAAVQYNGQFVAAVIAETSEVARHAAEEVFVGYEQEPHDVQLHPGRGDLYAPEQLMAGFQTDTAQGDFEAAYAAGEVTLDRTYTTPHCHNNPLEPHATVAVWEDEGLTLYDADQGAHSIRDAVARTFSLDPESVRVIARHVGGGFGSKVFPHPHQILTVMAARVAGRPVKLALTRQQMFTLVGHRTPTIQRLRLAADSEGHLSAIAHDVVEQSSVVKEFAEQTATGTRTMYAAPNRRTTHRIAALDLPAPTIMRAPGETPGMYALESAMDEMAYECGLDPIEFRRRNEPETEPESGLPFSSRGLVGCLRAGAERFGWHERDPRPRSRQDGRWLFGVGVAGATYPTGRSPATAIARVDGVGNYQVRIDASDIGTGAWTALTQIAADALQIPPERVDLEIGDSSLPRGPGAGGSRGTASWGSAVHLAGRNLRERLAGEFAGIVPEAGLEATGSVDGPPEAAEGYATHAFGAHFAEVRVDGATGEVRVPRMLGVFAAGRIINARTARSQFLGGMTMGLSMALHEQSVVDSQFGHYANHDLAEYHIATSADVGEIEVAWIKEEDPLVNELGAKGIGEIGMVGAAAAIANAIHHATGRRVRDLPITPDKLL